MKKNFDEPNETKFCNDLKRRYEVEFGAGV